MKWSPALSKPPTITAIASFSPTRTPIRAREEKIVQSFAEQRVDGIIVTSSRVGALYLPLLSEMMVPIVLVNDQYPGAFVHSVMIGNQDGSRRVAAEHLIGLGHRRIAYIGDQYGYQSDTERYAGYREALEAARIPVLPELVVRGDGKPEAAMHAMDESARAQPSSHRGLLLQRHDGFGSDALDPHAWAQRSRMKFPSRALTICLLRRTRSRR